MEHVNVLSCCEVTQDSLNPRYIIKEIEKDSLDYLRGKEMYVKYDTISGSSKFRIAVFERGSSIIKAAPHLCICNKCSDELDSCELFEEYHIVNHNLHKVFVRSCNKTQGQLEENDDNDADDTTDDFIVAGSGHELLWFVHIDIVDTATDVSSDHTILSGRYLEKKKEKKDGTYYHISKKQVFIAKESVVYPFVNFKHEHKGKSGELFLSNDDYTEILNFFEHTNNMAML